MRRSLIGAVLGMLCLAIPFWKQRDQNGRRLRFLEVQLSALSRKISDSWRPLILFLIKWLTAMRTKLIQMANDEEEPLSVSTENTELNVNQKGCTPPTTTMNGSNGHSSDQINNGHYEPSVTVRSSENHQFINEILHYWFEQYPPDESQKKLWMISSQTPSRRQKIDKEITQKFQSLMIELCETDRLDEWCTQAERYGYRGKVAAIVILDQFSRHMHRYYNESTPSLSSNPLPEQSVLDKLAFRTAKLVLKDHSAEIESSLVPMPMFIFALMPFRHEGTLDTVGLVQTLIEHSDDLWGQSRSMLQRFRKATNRRMAILQDANRRKGDSSKDDYTDEDILESFPFEADMSNAQTHAVVQAICSFLNERGIKPSKVNSDLSPIPMVISLSGGVDSMVIASVLAFLQKFQGYNIKITAVHIDYANRPDSLAESNYVEGYCAKHGIEFVVRRIDELTRGATSRDDYEKQTRMIRYNLYRDTVASCRDGYDGDVGVFLGHHRGDLRENVLSNAHKGAGPLDLSGMTSVSVNDGVTIYRPLLPLEKTFIFDYAHKFGVPYFKDTTPHWSTRGKLRNRLLPLLEEIYGEGSMNNLSCLALESDQCRKLLYDISLRPFLDAVKHYPVGISFETRAWKGQSNFFWKFVLREALHSAGLGMWSDKSVETFLERVRAKQAKDTWIQCRRDYGVHIRKDGVVFVFFPKSFPFRKSDSYRTDGVEIGYSGKGEENFVMVGPWQVSASWLVMEDTKSLQKEILVGTPAVESLEVLMKGLIEYYIRVPTWMTDSGSFEPRPLVFRKFDKPTRPRAWKGIDAKLQETLPLVGNDSDADRGIKDPRGAGCTHTNDKGSVVTNPTKVVKVTLRLAASKS